MVVLVDATGKLPEAQVSLKTRTLVGLEKQIIRMLQHVQPRIAWSKELEIRNQTITPGWTLGLNSVANNAL